MTPDEKYPTDGEFRDPVLRCEKCNKIVLVETLNTTGCCPLCGSVKYAALKTLNDEDRAKIEEWGVDPDYLKLWEPMPEGVKV